MSEMNQEKSEPAAAANAPAEVLIPQDQLLTDTLTRAFEDALQSEQRRAYEHWGFALFHSLSPERAQRELIHLGMKPRDALDHYNLGCLHAGDEKYAEAAKSFAAALQQKPDFVEALHNLALAQEMAGNLNDARKHWKDLLGVTEDEEEQSRIKQHLRELPAG